MQKNRQILAWAFYDWANSVFATCIMAGFFPILFKLYWQNNVEITLSTFRLGLTNSMASLTLIFIAPLLGSIADLKTSKKKFLLFFTLTGAWLTATLWLIPANAWQAAAIFYAFALISFYGANIFYDSLLIEVCPAADRNRVSSLGFALGYLGGGLLLALHLILIRHPELTTLTRPVDMLRLSFITVASWWLVFSIPTMIWVREKEEAKKKILLTSVLTRLKTGFRQIMNDKRLRTFLLAYLLYIDGVNTIIRMAIDYGLALGLAGQDLLIALLISQLVGFPAALIFGRIGQLIGTLRAIITGIIAYIVITAWAMFIHTSTEFFILAALIGLVQGGVQALSRSYYSTIIPPAKGAEYFGFFNIMGRFGAIIGPLLMGGSALIFGNPRLSLLVIIILFAGGGILLSRIKTDHPPLSTSQS